MKWLKRIIFLSLLVVALFAGTYGIQVDERKQYDRAVKYARNGDYETAKLLLADAVQRNPGYVRLRAAYYKVREDIRGKWGF
ncbi:MAG TPA: hypothetical protein P5287_04705 [bacterium]|nr:hypothetical protein [bacterium]